jgi:hypothetical protein
MTGDSDYLRTSSDQVDVIAKRSTWADAPANRAQDPQALGQRRQSFREWLIEAMHAGDRIAVTILYQRFTGTVEEVGEDVLGLRAIFGRVDLHLVAGIPLHIELVDHPTSGGHHGQTDRLFGALLAARDPNADTTVGTVIHPDGLDGQVSVGSDFLITKARAGAVTVIPFAQVAWVCDRRT